MDNKTSNHIRQIFRETLKLPPEERKTFLDNSCKGNDDIRAEVEKLLSAHEEGRGSPRSPTVSIDKSRPPAEGAGTKIGRYKLLQLIGEGAFGSVYMAEQERPVRRKIALKIIKLGMDTRQVIARFEAERQALALMDHPNIARVIDAGATETGRPYFVMELVRGVPITEYCDQNNLTTRERLELFQSVCSAVEHAHQKGIIHRDIKPSNVMVTLHDGIPVVKVIDFGIAKATNQRLTEKTLFTEYNQFVGTPQYMSPEQAEMSGLDVDTRTDIYALGVLLYELLTGTTPFDSDRLRNLNYTEIHRMIREDDPDRPSTRVSTLGEAAIKAAKRRATDVSTLRKTLSGDLDWIVMRTIEKDRTRRYDTANALRLDIQRHLRNESVLASPPSVIYRTRKFVKRNRTMVVVAAVVGFTLIGGSVLAMIGFTQARKERAVARAEAESARSINGFFADMLASVDPQQLRLHSAFAPAQGVATTAESGFDRNVSVVEMLKRGGERLEETFRGKPQLEAEARETIGITLAGLGQWDDAKLHLERAVEIRDSIYPEDHPDRLRSELQLGHHLRDADRVRVARDGFERVYGPEHPKTLSATSILANVLTLDRSDWGPFIGLSKFSSAEDVFRETLEKQRRVLGDEHRDVVFTMLEWANWYMWQGRGEEAEKLLREGYETTRRVFSPDDILTLRAATALGWSLNFQGEYEEGEKYLREALEKHERVLGPNHPETSFTLMGLGRSLQRPEYLDEKEEVLRRALAGLRETEEWGNFPGSFVISRDLAFLLLRRGKEDEAIQLARELYEACLNVYGESNYWTVYAERCLFNDLCGADRHGEARAHVKDRLEKLRRRAEREDATVVEINEFAWELLTCWPPVLRNPESALPFVERALEMAAPGDSSQILDTAAKAYYMTGDLPRAIETQRKAVALLESRIDPDAEDYVLEIVRYLTLAGDADAVIEETHRHVLKMREQTAGDRADLAGDLRDFGRSLADEGLWPAGEVALHEAVVVYEGMTASEPDDHIQTLIDLCGAYLHQGKLVEAENRFGQAKALVVEVYGEESTEYAEVLDDFGAHLSQCDRGHEAVSCYRRAIEICSALGEEGVKTLRYVELDLADELTLLRETGEAIRIARKLIDYWSEERGETYSRTGHSRRVLGMAHLGAGNLDDAEKELLEALHILRINLEEDEDPVRFAETEAALAECLTIQGRHTKAEPLLIRAYERVREYGKDRPMARKRILERLVKLYEAWGKPAEADKWRDLQVELTGMK